MAYETATRDAAEQRQDRTQAKPAQGSIVDDRRSSTNAGLQLQTKMASSTLQRNSVAAQSPVQFVTGQHGLDNIKAQIHQGTGRAAQIATDIYNVDVGATHDGDFRNNTIPKIIQSAEEFGYSNAYATRLANNNPFAIGDIPAATSWVNQVARRVESFEFSGEIANNDPAVVSSHQLNFENLYPDSGDAVFKFNARNPALASFYASDVVEAQRQWIKGQLGNPDAPPINTVTRENVQSVNGQQWRLRHPAWGAMSSDALQDFLANTDNGKSTVALLAGQEKVVTGGEVLRYRPADPLSTEFSVKLTVEDRVIPSWWPE